MNPHKESWQQQVGIVPKRSKAHLAKRFMVARDRMFKGHSDRTKWERIGRPLFVETPFQVAEGVSNVLFFYGKGKKMVTLLQEDNLKRMLHPFFGWK